VRAGLKRGLVSGNFARQEWGINPCEPEQGGVSTAGLGESDVTPVCVSGIELIKNLKVVASITDLKSSAALGGKGGRGVRKVASISGG